jgi:PAS domain S-box-containing protein
MEIQAGWALVIDADTSAHIVYQEALSELGFDVDICDRGASASLSLMRRVYDVILLDPRTPGIGGLEILNQTYRQLLPVPAVVIGSEAANDSNLTERPVSMPGVLSKPFSADELRQVVAQTVRERRDDQQLALRAAAYANNWQVGEHDLSLLYNYLVRMLLAKFEADRTSLMLWSGDNDQVDVVASAGFPFTIPGSTSALLNDSVSGWVIRHAEPVLLEPDGELPFDLQSAWRNQAICSGICVPLVARAQVLGVLAIARRSGRAAFTSSDLDQMVYLASQVAAVLENVRLNTQTQHRMQLLSRLNAISTALLATSDLDQILDLTVDQIVDVFPQAQGYLFLREAQSPWIDRLIVVGKAPLHMPNLDDLRDQPGLAGQVLADGVPRLHRPTDLPHELASWEQRLLGLMQQLLCAPLKTNASVYGAIELVDQQKAFDEEEVQFVAALAGLVALALEKSQIHTAVARQAARYNVLFEGATDAILLIDRERRAIVAANPAAERMSGYSQSDLALIAPARLIAPAMIGRPSVPVAELLAGTVSEYDGYIRTRSGYSVPVSIAVNEVVYEATRYLLLVVRNMSEAQRYAQQMAQSEKLSGMNRLTAAIAHEVNNPLQALHNTLHLLISRSFTEEKRERLLSMAQMEVDRLTVIVRRMLELHRPTSADMRLVSIHSLLEGAIASAAPQLQQHHVLIERHWAEQLPWVTGIGGHLKQVFQDLVTNAAEAMPNGGRLLVCTRLEEGQGSQISPRVMVEFVDTGPGIPESETQLIFEPFYTTKRANTGLGLAISYSIIERHGGTLTVSSSASGTTFRVMLPAAATTFS